MNAHRTRVKVETRHGEVVACNMVYIVPAVGDSIAVKRQMNQEDEGFDWNSHDTYKVREVIHDWTLIKTDRGTIIDENPVRIIVE